MYDKHRVLRAAPGWWPLPLGLRDVHIKSDGMSNVNNGECKEGG